MRPMRAALSCEAPVGHGLVEEQPAGQQDPPQQLTQECCEAAWPPAAGLAGLKAWSPAQT